MQSLNEGQSYSSMINMIFPLENLREVSLMWFKKKLSFGSNTLMFRHISIEPLYAASLHDQRMMTKIFCGNQIPIQGKSEYPVVFNINCRPW